MDFDRKLELIKLYFEAGYPYSLILRFLTQLHGIVLSMRTLKRMLHRMGLRRRGCCYDLGTIFDCVQVGMTTDMVTDSNRLFTVV